MFFRVLAKKYYPKKKEEEDYQFTYAQAFLRVLHELTDVAGQHEVVAEKFREEVVRDVATTSRDLREQRKIVSLFKNSLILSHCNGRFLIAFFRGAKATSSLG